MANDIVAGLFGLSPSQVQQQQQAAIQQQAAAYARQAPFERAAAGMYQGGAGLAGIGAGMMGMVNPEVEAAKQREDVLSQADLQTPEGILKAAEMARQRGDVKMQLQLQMLARQRMAETKKEDSPFAKIDPKDYTSESLKVFAQTKDPTDLIAKTEAPKAPPSRTRISGGIQIQEELQSDGTWKEVGRGERFAKQITGIGGGVVQKPKGLTREASLKWDLDNGLIDQATYDASISATPGEKLKAERIGAANTALTGFDAVERNIDALYNPKTKSLTDAAKPLFGKYAQYRPDVLQSQETVDANLALESLTNQVMMANLADAKERVGQSFGSMQVQEWDKFTQQLTSLKRGLSEKSAAESMEYVKNFIKTKRNVLKVALGDAKIGQQSVPNGDLSIEERLKKYSK